MASSSSTDPPSPAMAATPVRKRIIKRKRICDWPGCGKAFAGPAPLMAPKRFRTGEKPHQYTARRSESLDEWFMEE